MWSLSEKDRQLDIDLRAPTIHFLRGDNAPKYSLVGPAPGGSDTKGAGGYVAQEAVAEDSIKVQGRLTIEAESHATRASGLRSDGSGKIRIGAHEEMGEVDADGDSSAAPLVRACSEDDGGTVVVSRSSWMERIKRRFEASDSDA